uniref:Fibrinogen C-terminal domain-containing protein n=1 Tax=Rhabditophanes sp. KR3021 TaxID=114890 RepID=A0AC35U5T8_9BILA
MKIYCFLLSTILLLCLHKSTADTKPPHCHDKYTYSEVLGQCWSVVSDHTDTISEAEFHCKKFHGNLVSIETLIKNHAVSEYFDKYAATHSRCHNRGWIGLYYESISKDYQWYSGEPKTYTNWAKPPTNFSLQVGVYYDFATLKWDLADKNSLYCFMCVSPPEVYSCKDVLMNNPNAPSGEYLINVQGELVNVQCDMTTDGGGWIVIQKRDDGTTSFYDKTWQEYKDGFGDLSGNYNFWLGNHAVSALTGSIGPFKLRVEINGDRNGTNTDKTVSWNGSFDFRLMPEFTNYTLKISNASGSATAGGWDDFTVHNMYPFSTIDRNNALYGPCVSDFHLSGWWLKFCGMGSLNGQYVPPIQYKNGYGYSWVITVPNDIVTPVSSRMLIRETN